MRRQQPLPPTNSTRPSRHSASLIAQRVLVKLDYALLTPGASRSLPESPKPGGRRTNNEPPPPTSAATTAGSSTPRSYNMASGKEYQQQAPQLQPLQPLPPLQQTITKAASSSSSQSQQYPPAARPYHSTQYAQPLPYATQQQDLPPQPQSATFNHNRRAGDFTAKPIHLQLPVRPRPSPASPATSVGNFESGTAYTESDADDEYDSHGPVDVSPSRGYEEESPIDGYDEGASSSAIEDEDDIYSDQHTPTIYRNPDLTRLPQLVITDWTAEDCADFISTIGLSQYADAFVGML